MKTFILGLITIFLICSCGNDNSQSEGASSHLETKADNVEVTDPIDSPKEVSIPRLVIEKVFNPTQSYFYNGNEVFKAIGKSSRIESGFLARKKLLRLANNELVQKENDLYIEKIDSIEMSNGNFWIFPREKELGYQENFKNSHASTYSVTAEIMLNLKGSDDVYSRIRNIKVGLYRFSDLDGSFKKIGSSLLSRDGQSQLTLDVSNQDQSNKKIYKIEIFSNELASKYLESKGRLFITIDDYELVKKDQTFKLRSNLISKELSNSPYLVFSTKDELTVIKAKEGESLRDCLKSKYKFIEEDSESNVVKIEKYWADLSPAIEWRNPKSEFLEKNILVPLNGLNLDSKLEKGKVYSLVHAQARDILLGNAKWSETMVEGLPSGLQYIGIRVYKKKNVPGERYKRTVRVRFQERVRRPRGGSEDITVREDIDATWQRDISTQASYVDFIKLNQNDFRLFDGEKVVSINEDQYHAFSGVFLVNKMGAVDIKNDFDRKIGEASVDFIDIDDRSYYERRGFSIETQTHPRKVALYERFEYHIKRRTLVPEFR